MNISKLAEVLKAATPRAQVERIGNAIEKLPDSDLKQHARKRLNDATAMIDADGHVERWQLFHIAIEDARRTAREAVFQPLLIRDRDRQAGTRKKRWPECDQWIDRQLAHDPSAKSPALWKRAPEWITDRIEYDRFTKRVTAARKRL